METCPRAGNPAVRTDDAYAQRLIEFGIERSPTFSALVDALETTDIVVIVEPYANLSQTLNGYLAYMSTTSACRYVRVRFTTRATKMHAIAIIGHELQHALEVGLHPEVVDAASLRAMYEIYGQRSNGENAFESVEADRAGRVIGMELFAKPAAATPLNADVDR